MKVKDLIELLEQCNPESSVIVEIKKIEWNGSMEVDVEVTGLTVTATTVEITYK